MLLLLLACALSLGGWFVVAPLIATHASAAPPPASELETAASGARFASMPARAFDAALRAAAPNAASAASGVGDAARCGEDQLAVYKNPQADPDDGMIHVEMPTPDLDGIVRHMPGEIRPAGVGYTGAQRRIDAALRASGDPFDRSVADWLNVDGLRTPSAQLAALVQDAVDTDDARSYALAFETCNGMSALFLVSDPRPTSTACVRLDVAEWARRDPGNGVPWLYALQRANRAGDAAGQREALRRLAVSPRFDQHFGVAPAAVARLQLPSDADLAAQVDVTMQAVGASGFAPFSDLTRHCRDKAGGDREVGQLCEQIGGLLFDHADTMIGRALGGAVHKLATGDASWLDRAHREQTALGRYAQPDAVPGPCGSERTLLRDFVHRGAVGELAAMRERASASAVH